MVCSFFSYTTTENIAYMTGLDSAEKRICFANRSVAQWLGLLLPTWRASRVRILVTPTFL